MLIQGRSQPSRRAFLARLAAIAAVPSALTACSSQTDKTDPKAGDSEGTIEPLVKLTGKRPDLPDAQPMMRVRIFRSRDENTKITIGPEQQHLRLFPVYEGGGEAIVKGPLKITVSDKGWSIIDADGYRVPVNDLKSLDIASTSSTPELVVNKRVYPGSLRLISRTDISHGSFDIINIVPIEAYLPGVVAGELYSHWHLQTKAAQAIAARSFACSEHAYFTGRRAYDVTDTAQSQMYIGAVKHEETRLAVTMTRGMVLEYENKLVPGYYSSCCGGRAARAIDVIGKHHANNVAPLDGRVGEDVCVSEKVANWTVKRPLETLTRRLIAYGTKYKREELSGLAEIASITITKTNQHQRPTHFKITDVVEHSAEMSAESFMRAANYKGQGLNKPTEPLLSSFVSVHVEDSQVVFQGHGLGHGVGLCQYGAEQLAKSGKDYREILNWYYPGAKIVQTYN